MESELFFTLRDTIIRPGFVAPGLYLITAGSVIREYKGERTHLGIGDFFGEEGAFLGVPAPYTIAATEDTAIAVLDKGELFDLLMSDRDFLKRMIGKLVSFSWDTFIQSEENIEDIFLLSIVEQTIDIVGENGEIALALFSERSGIPEETVIALADRLAFQDVALSIQGDSLSFSKESIQQFLTKTRKQLFLKKRLGGSLSRPKGVGETSLLYATLHNE